MPRIFKRTKKEEDIVYEDRVRNYLTIMKDENFEKVGDLIDPEDPLQNQFFQLYNEVLAERNGTNPAEKKDKGCVIF